MNDDFQGTERYQVVRRLGAGGMGVVYEALDRQRNNQRVALKVLRATDADGLVRLKREFRALSDLSHPNLVSLYELVAEATRWFFTLELIDGVDFMSWVRPGHGSFAQQTTASLAATIRTPPQKQNLVDLDRLRGAMRQLVEGVAALHAHGRTHRDLKPQNVLVTPSGRVVVLDFGLVADLEGDASISEERGHALLGTAAYMAPEQSGPTPSTPAADWYAVGCMLFQALTGALPFEGAPLQVLLEKQTRRPDRPGSRTSAVPADLDGLCHALLNPDPEQRPGVEEILSVLGAPVRAGPGFDAEVPFVGRHDALAVLRQSLEATRRGTPQLVRIAGPSGQGKSALVRRFLEGAAKTSNAVVLAGRCHERESVPFKALDSAIDALARFLAQLPDEKADAVLPRDAYALSRMFPVLGRVAAFARAPHRELADPGELRRRAGAALRELLARLADRRCVIVFIDDVQWGDDDSASVLSELLRPPDPPAFLLIIAAREPEQWPTPQAPAGTLVDLPLRPLGPEEVAELVSQLAPRASNALAARITRDAEGNPLLVQQLATFAQDRDDIRLEDVVTASLDGLTAEERTLLEVASLAVRPLSAEQLCDAAGSQKDALPSLLKLRAARLLRAVPTTQGPGELLEPWHDRIRDVVLNRVTDDQRKACHVAIAATLEKTGPLEAQLAHLELAGMGDRATDVALRAADEAAGLLAFDREAQLLERALSGLTRDDPRRRSLQVRRARALADAGHGPESAGAYRAALEEPGLSEVDAIELERLAAEQLLRAGHVDEGLASIRVVLERLDMTLARTPVRALGALLFRRAHLSLRGLEFTPRSEAEVEPVLLRKIDACWSVSIGLGMIDTIRGASFQTRQLLLALDAGEPYRIARALAAEAAFVATAGAPAEARAALLLKDSWRIGTRVSDPRLQGLLEFCTGLTRFLVGSWTEAAAHSARAEEHFAAAGTPVSWEAASARLFSVWSLFYLGDLEALGARVPMLLDEARRRGDRYAQVSLQTGLANMVKLATGDAAGARAQVREAMAGWPSKNFHFQHYWALLSEGLTDLYEGLGAQAWERVTLQWPSLKSSMLLRIQNVRVEARFLRGRAAIAAGRSFDALADAERLEGEGVEWALAFAAILRGGVAATQGRLDRATEAFALARERADASSMPLFSAAARARVGELTGGGVGRANEIASHAALATRGIANPAAFVRLLAPIGAQ